MGLSGEKGPLGENKREKEKEKKGEGEAPWALGPMWVAPPPPLAGHPPWHMWDSPNC